MNGVDVLINFEPMSESETRIVAPTVVMARAMSQPEGNTLNGLNDIRAMMNLGLYCVQINLMAKCW